MQDILTTIATAVEIAAAMLFIGGFLAHVASATGQPQAAPDRATEVPDTEPSELPELFAMADDISNRYHAESVTPVAPLLPTVLENATVADLDFQALSPYELRDRCQQAGIKWRNARGRNKHLSKRDMVAVLATA
jgi:hypothetical protein